jgi:HEAT repeat protein
MSGAYKLENGDTFQVTGPNWFEGMKRPRRSGAIAVLYDGRLRLLLPRGFLARWHQADLVNIRQTTSLIGALTSAELRELLCAGKAEDRLMAANALLSQGREAFTAIPALLVALASDELTAVRWRAVETLRRLDLPSYAFPLLALALRSDVSRSVRWRAAEALGAQSMPPKERSEALLQASGDKDHWVRWHAHRVLTHVVDPPLLRSLILRYAGGSSVTMVRTYALRLLTAQDRFDRNSLLHLVAGLWADEPEVRRCTVELVDRHRIAEHDEQARLGLGQCLQDLQPEVRESAVRAISHLTRRRAGIRLQFEGTLGDPNPAVRAAFHEEVPYVRGTIHVRQRWLRIGLSDPVLSVRLKAALALHRLEVADGAVVAALASTLWQQEPPLDAWRALMTLTNIHEDQIAATISSLPCAVLRHVVAMDVAAGSLPTIGLRLWHSRARIRFPNKEGGDRTAVGLGYPWVNAGVHHYWECHKPPLHLRIDGVVKQVTLAVEPFPFSHLIAAVEYGRYLPPGIDGRIAPVHIEGRPVGSIIEGGNVSDLLAPSEVPKNAVGRRLDFLFVIDLQLCQYGSFGATCARVHHIGQPLAQRNGAHTWSLFVERLSQILTDFELREFVEMGWFEPSGWQSSRYGRRHERHYDDIREGVAQLFAKLRSPSGKRLRNLMIKVAGEFTEEVEATIWSARLTTYSPKVLAVLASGAAGERAAFHAARLINS